MSALAQHGGIENGQKFLLRFLRTTMSFETTRSALRARTSGELGRLLCPDRYSPATKFSEARKDRRFERYAMGKNAIPANLIARGEQLTAGIGVHFPELLFAALDISVPLSTRVNELLSRASTDVQAAIFQRTASKNNPFVRRKKGLSQMLMRRASSHGVAAMIILLREAHEAGNRALSLDRGGTLYFMVLVWCSRRPIWESHREIIIYLVNYIFPLAFGTEIRLNISCLSLAQTIAALRFHVFQLNRMPLKMRMDGINGASPGWDLLAQGEYGTEYLWGLRPLLALTSSAKESSVNARQEVSRCLVLCTWAWRSLRLLENNLFPPTHVLQLASKDANQLTQRDIDSIETTDECILNGSHGWMQSPLANDDAP